MKFAMRLPEKTCESNSHLLRHAKFVLSWRAKKGQYAPASGSLGVSRELHLTLFPPGQPRRRLALQK